MADPGLTSSATPPAGADPALLRGLTDTYHPAPVDAPAHARRWDPCGRTAARVRWPAPILADGAQPPGERAGAARAHRPGRPPPQPHLHTRASRVRTQPWSWRCSIRCHPARVSRIGARSVAPSTASTRIGASGAGALRTGPPTTVRQPRTATGTGRTAPAPSPGPRREADLPDPPARHPRPVLHAPLGTRKDPNPYPSRDPDPALPAFERRPRPVAAEHGPPGAEPGARHRPAVPRRPVVVELPVRAIGRDAQQRVAVPCGLRSARGASRRRASPIDRRPRSDQREVRLQSVLREPRPYECAPARAQPLDGVLGLTCGRGTPSPPCTGTST